MDRLAAIGVGLLLANSFAAAQQTATSSSLSIMLPGVPWSLTVDSDGYKVQQNGVQPDGRAYLEAENESTGVTLSVFLERVPGQATNDGCKENEDARLAQKPEYKRENIERKQVAGMAAVEYTIPEFRGVPVRQRNLFVCLPKGDVYVDIHLSKPAFQPKDEDLFAAALHSIRFPDAPANSKSVEGNQSSPGHASIDYFREGSRYYLAQDFQSAIGPYQKALDAEKQTRQLSANLWHVLIDNLGMAYGLTGDLDRAEEIFDYGVAQDPKYPLFYYNLACVAAGRHDVNKTTELLKKAFSLKQNVLPGESMPDPKTDDSFQPFLTNPEFRKFIDSL